MSLIIKVTISNRDGTVLKQYFMDHDSAEQRRVLGEQCRYAFEAGQTVNTSPVSK